MNLLGFCFVAFLCSFTYGKESKSDHTSLRLPKEIIPENYHLQVLTHLGDDGKFEFNGTVRITAKVIGPIKNFILHTKGLHIHEPDTTIKDITDTKAPKNAEYTRLSYDEKFDFVEFYMSNGLEENHKYELSIRFWGHLNDSLSGFYRSSYKDADGKTRYMAVTQFEPTYARMAFPCFDEPNLKATFEISIGRREEFNSISNMPLSRTEPIEGMPGWFWDHYQKSVPMSTYLVAYAVTDFAYKTSLPIPDSNAIFRVWARNDSLYMVDYAAEVGPKSLSFFEKFFNISYPLPKQDMIAVPDFSAGAMENWGMITYREAYLLYHPTTSTISQKHSIASIVAHELAHQWFGNLVTMKWWTDLWLNEGFATYMASLAVHNLYPEWKSLDEEVLNNILAVFSLDVLKTSHPVSVNITHPSLIGEIFDTISYKKGSFLLRMIDHFLGSETFRKGVTRYLLKHEYGNAEQDDLWDSLTVQAHQDGTLPKNLTVKAIMDTWTLQTGYPLINATRNYKDNTIQLWQERYVRNRTTNECWWVPITYTDQQELDFKSTQAKGWMSCPSETFIINGPPANKWFILNIQATSLYKVNYDLKNWQMLSATLNSDSYKDIAMLNRAQLIEDAASLSSTERLDYKVFFELLQYAKRETEYLPWKSILNSLQDLTTMIKRTPSYGPFKKFLKELLTPIYETLGRLQIKENDSLQSLKFQVLIASWSCKFEVDDCISQATELFKQWQREPENKSLIPKDLRSTIYCTALRNGGEDEWNFLWKQYLNTTNPTEKPVMLRALSCTREVWLLRKYLELSITPDSGVRKQDCSSVFSGVVRNEIGYYVAKSFLLENVKAIHNYISSPRRLSSYLVSLANQMIYEEDYKELERFTETNKHLLSESKQSVKQSLETVLLNVRWQHFHYSYVSAYINAVNNK